MPSSELEDLLAQTGRRPKASVIDQHIETLEDSDRELFDQYVDRGLASNLPPHSMARVIKNRFRFECSTQTIVKWLRDREE